MISRWQIKLVKNPERNKTSDNDDDGRCTCSNPCKCSRLFVDFIDLCNRYNYGSFHKPSQSGVCSQKQVAQMTHFTSRYIASLTWHEAPGL